NRLSVGRTLLFLPAGQEAQTVKAAVVTPQPAKSGNQETLGSSGNIGKDESACSWLNRLNGRSPDARTACNTPLEKKPTQKIQARTPHPVKKDKPVQVAAATKTRLDTEELGNKVLPD